MDNLVINIEDINTKYSENDLRTLIKNHKGDFILTIPLTGNPRQPIEIAYEYLKATFASEALLECCPFEDLYRFVV